MTRQILANWRTPPSCYLLVALISPSAYASPQAPSATQAEQRVRTLADRSKQCDRAKSEGELADCYQKLLVDCETEINRLNLEVRRDLPKSEQPRFDQAATDWRRFYASEKVHFKSMLNVQGSVRHIGYLSSLADLLIARCEELLLQLQP